jgi:WD40 repeat protein
MAVGTYSGQVLSSKINSKSHRKEAHNAPCAAMHLRKGDTGFISAGFDGLILYWDALFNRGITVALHTELKQRLVSYKIQSIFEDKSSGDLVIGNYSGDIIEKSGANWKVVVKGASAALTGLDKFYNKTEVATICNEREITVWDSGKKSVRVIPIEYEGSQIACHPEGVHLAVGFMNGYVSIVDNTSLTSANVLKKIKDRTTAITAIKYSPKSSTSANSNSLYLAVGSADMSLSVYNVRENYKFVSKVKFLNGVPKSIDFTDDGRFIMVSTDSNELRYYEVQKGERITLTTDTQKLKFTDLTASFGRGLWGVYSNNDGAEVTCACVNFSKTIVAVGLSNGNIRLYQYPCVTPNPIYSQYLGHTGPVSKILFTDDEAFLLSLGLDDRALIQWDCKRFPEEVEIEEDQATVPKDQKYFENLAKRYVPNPPAKREEVRTYKDEAKNNTLNRFDGKMPKTSGEAPDNNLELRYVFGVKTQGATNGVRYADESKILFFSGNKAILMTAEKDKKTQTFFRMHNSEITALDLTKNKKTAATGDAGKPGQQNTVYIWNIETKDVLGQLTTKGTDGILRLKFSAEGIKLLTVSNDEHHTIDVFDSVNMVHLSSVKNDSRFIVDVFFKNDLEFVTLTRTTVRFWDIQGANLVSTKGREIPNDKKEYTSGTFAFLQNICFTGCRDGRICWWQEKAILQANVTACKEDKKDLNDQGRREGSAVIVMVCHKNNLYSGCEDGTIKSWSYSGKLTLGKDIKLPVNKPASFSALFEVRSLDISPEGIYLLSTNQGNIFTFSDSNFQMVVQGHRSQSVNAIAVHPTKRSFVTAGDDKKLNLWNLDSKILETSIDTTEVVVALDWSRNGSLIVGARANGTIGLFDYTSELRPSPSVPTAFTNPITQVKFSPDSKKIAVTALDHPMIQIFEIGGSSSIIEAVKIPMNNSFIQYLEWSTTSDYLACACDNFELKYFSLLHNTKPVAFSEVKDRSWLNWSLPIGPMVYGIDINEQLLRNTSVCRSWRMKEDSKDYSSNLKAVVGDQNGNLRLYNFPAYAEHADCKTYNSHTMNVTGICFMPDDNFVVAISDKDSSIVVFETDLKVPDKGFDMKVQDLADKPEEELNSGLNWESGARESLKTRRNNVGGRQRENDRDISKFQGDKQAEEMEENAKNQRQWIAAVKYPTEYIKPEINSEKAPKLRLTKEHVFGFRAKDTRRNLKYLNQKEFVYATAGMIVIQKLSESQGKPEPHSQRIFDKHSNDVTAFSLKKSTNLIASGDIGNNPTILIWEAYSLAVITEIKTQGIMGLSLLEFSPDGSNFLFALSIDPKNTISIFNYLSGALVHRVSGDSCKINDVRWTTSTDFMTVGVNHVKMWQMDSNNLKSVRCKPVKNEDKKSTEMEAKKAMDLKILCCAVKGKDVLVGTAEGQVLQLKNIVGQIHTTNFLPLPDFNKGMDWTIESISVTNDNVFIGISIEGKTGLIMLLDANSCKHITTIELGKLNIDSEILNPRSMDTTSDGKKIIFGTFASEIFQLKTDDLSVSRNTKYEPRLLTQGAHSFGGSEPLQMWGLAVFKLTENQGKFITCSDDGLVRIWSVADKTCLKIVCDKNSKGDSARGTGDAKLRCIALHPREEMAAVGCKSGAIKVFPY